MTSLNPPISNQAISNQTAPDLAKLRQTIEAAANATTLADAVKDLAAAAIPESAPDLIRALNYNNPGAAVAAVDGLIAIGEPAVAPLLELLDDYNYGARAWALRALSGIGDMRSLALLLDTAQNDFAMSVRRAATRGLGSMQWVGEDTTIAQGQADCVTALVKICHDPEWVVRYAAIAALENLGYSTAVMAQLVTISQSDPETAVQARAQLALDRLG
jgi:phycocyanobilin lyase subunit beta